MLDLRDMGLEVSTHIGGSRLTHRGKPIYLINKQPTTGVHGETP